MIETLIAGITAFDIYYAPLPDKAYSYDGEERSISQFYDQKIPNVYIGGTYVLDDNDGIVWSVNTGTHTEKLNTGNVGLHWKHVHQFKDPMWTLSSQIGADVSISKHKPCTDSYDRKYYCTNLTAWSDFEREHNEIHTNPKISLTIGYRW